MPLTCWLAASRISWVDSGRSACNMAWRIASRWRVLRSDGWEAEESDKADDAEVADVPDVPDMEEAWAGIAERVSVGMG